MGVSSREASHGDLIWYRAFLGRFISMCLFIVSGAPNVTGPKSSRGLTQVTRHLWHLRWSKEDVKYRVHCRLRYPRKLRNSTELKPSQFHAKRRIRKYMYAKYLHSGLSNDLVYPVLSQRPYRIKQAIRGISHDAATGYQKRRTTIFRPHSEA